MGKQMSIQRICDVCSRIKQDANGVSTIHRYTLRREEGTRYTKTRKQTGAGGIDMCDECWTKICKPRTNANKSRVARSRWASLSPEEAEHQYQHGTLLSKKQGPK
jgi:hypothetical protein